MHYFITKEQRKADEQLILDQNKKVMEEAAKRAEARKAWEKAHPPCPTCGRRDAAPFVDDWHWGTW